MREVWECWRRAGKVGGGLGMVWERWVQYLEGGDRNAYTKCDAVHKFGLELQLSTEIYELCHINTPFI